MAFYIRTAGLTFRIEPNFSTIERYCAGYTCPADEAAINASVTHDEIEAERVPAVKAAEAEGRSTDFTPAQLELLAVHKKISELMPGYGAFLFHGSTVEVDGEAYVFTAKSGTGKSTHAALWRKKFGERAVMINDDKPFILIRDGRAFACGSPWNGKHRLGSDLTVPIKAVYLLNRGNINKVYNIKKSEAFPSLYEQTYRPDDPGMLTKTLILLDKLASTAKLYRLYCNMQPEAADTAYEALEDRS